MVSLPIFASAMLLFPFPFPQELQHLIRFDGAAAAAGARVDLVETWSAPSGHPILRLVRLTLQ